MQQSIASVALLVSASTMSAVPPTAADAVGTSDPFVRPIVHVEGPHVRSEGDEWIYRWVSGDHVREDRVPKSGVTEVPAWGGAPAIPASLLEPVEPPAAAFEMPARVFAVGDVHGRFASFLAVLREADVIDESGAWSYGTDHLVCCGDLMNRDGDVVGLLWFLRQLEVEAAEAGGAVHVILGNHEQLALQGDERYVHENQLAASRRLGVGYASLYGPDSVLGRWLRTKPSIIRIGATTFTHGGVSPELVELAEANDLDVDAINRIMRENLGASRAIRRSDPVLEGLFGTWGPFWHRGYFFEDDRYFPTSSEGLDRVLRWLGTDRIVVGHTEFERVGSHMGGRVIATDVNLDRTPEAVLITGEGIVRVRVGAAPESLTPLPAR